MLTLREPIQLKTGLTLTGGTEAFGQRLNGNYGLMTARIAPKDLLFLVTTPPEFPEDLGGVSSLELRNAFTDIQQTKVDVVNNVLNRIVLNQDHHFTYQDQVYITSVLRKLGVQDVSHFMEEVRRLREEQENLTTLTRLYRQETTRRALTTLRQEGEGGSKETAASAGEAAGKQAPAPRYYLHQDIYHRLGTGDIYQQVAAFYHNVTGLGDTFTNQELRLSEQLRVSQSLRLQEERRHNVYGGAVALHHHVNRYEQGDILPPPETQEQVLSQAAEAALLTTVDHMLTHTLERHMTDKDTWLTLNHSLTQVAENSLSRFETYHTQNTNRFRDGDSYHSWYRALEEREIQTLRQLGESWHTRETLERTGVPAAGEAFPPGLQSPAELTYLAPGQAPEGAEPESPPTEGRTGLTTLELTNLTQQILGRERRPDGRPARPEPRPEERDEETLRTILRQQRESLIYRQTGQAPGEETPAGAPPAESAAQLIRQTLRETILPGEEGRAASQSPAIRETVERLRELRQEELYHTSRQAALTLRELAGMERDTVVLEQQSIPLSDQPAAQIPPDRQIRQTLEVLRQEGERQTTQHIYTEQKTAAAPAPPAEQVHREAALPQEEGEATVSAAVPAAQATPEQLMRELREIDRLNRERVERIRTMEQPQVRQVRPTAADQARTRADALRALEQPELVLRQLEEARQEEPTQGSVPPQVEQILRQADPMTRKLYETVVKYQRDPRAAVAEGLVHASNVGAFNADTAQRQAAAEQPGEGAALHFPSPATEEPQLPPAGEQALEHLREGARRRGAQPHRPGSWEKLPFVFKREDNSAYEELIQRLEEQRTQQTIQQPVHEEITRQSTSQTQINEINRQVVDHTTEDITALINRTMAQQMNQITSQVYRQMERRLQTERNRRGRF